MRAGRGGKKKRLEDGRGGRGGAREGRGGVQAKHSLNNLRRRHVEASELKSKFWIC
jgi:hypothetical protein